MRKLVFAALTDWRTSMQFCGGLCVLTGTVCFLLLKDYPDGVTPPTPTPAAQVFDTILSGQQPALIKKHVFLNVSVQLLALIYLLSYVVKQGLSNWLPPPT